MARYEKKFANRIHAINGLTGDFDPAADVFGRPRKLGRGEHAATSGDEDVEDRQGRRFGFYGKGWFWIAYVEADDAEHLERRGWTKEAA